MTQWLVGDSISSEENKCKVLWEYARIFQTENASSMFEMKNASAFC